MNVQPDDQIEAVTLDLINATFQGLLYAHHFNLTRKLSGVGIILDDQFNLFLSSWVNNAFHGPTFIKLINDIIIYGCWDQQMKGIITIQLGQITIYFNFKSSNWPSQWGSHAAVFDKKQLILYVLELFAQSEEQQSSFTSKSNSDAFSSSAKLSARLPKIKIIERLKLDKKSNIPPHSKFMKNQVLQLEIQPCNKVEQTVIKFLTAIFHCQVGLQNINLETFLRKISLKQQVLKVFTKNVVHLSDPAQLQISLNLHQIKEKQLGIVLNQSDWSTTSIGFFTNESLNGLGVSFSKNGEVFVGIFKDNILVREYNYDTKKKSKLSLSSFAVKELLANEHLKSQNYLHELIYFGEINPTVKFSRKILKYIETFERQFQKKNLTYNDTSHFSSSEQDFEKYELVKDQRNNQVVKEVKNESTVKKPGFIFDRSKSKSPLRRSSSSDRVKSKNKKSIGSIYKVKSGVGLEESSLSKRSEVKKGSVERRMG